TRRRLGRRCFSRRFRRRRFRRRRLRWGGRGWGWRGGVWGGGGPRGVGRGSTRENFFRPREREGGAPPRVHPEQRPTAGIVPMLVGASGRYAEIEIAGMGVGLVVGTLASFVFQDPWAAIHSQLLWPLAGAALGSILCSIPVIKRNLIPRDRIVEAVDLRSLA